MNKDLKQRYLNYLNENKVNDLFSENTKVLLVFESPHKKEIKKGIPLSGSSGINVTKKLVPCCTIPFGEIIYASKNKTIGIMNVSQAPMNAIKATNASFKELEHLKRKLEKGKSFRLTEEELELYETIKNHFKKRLMRAINCCGENLIIVACGLVATSFCEDLKLKRSFYRLNHPSYGKWNYPENTKEYDILKQIKSYLPVEILEKNSADTYLRTMFSKCVSSLGEQTDIWHINSSKKVAACIYLDTKDDYITAQNIGISKVDGSSCAEKNAIITAVSKYPEIEMNEFKYLFVLSEKGKILPCGVCCEWLTKLNPAMNLYTVYDDKHFIKIRLNTYYGDEIEIERYLYQSSFY